MLHGTIKYYDKALGHGMIKPSDQSRDVFFTKEVVKGGIKWVSPRVPVTYELYKLGNPEAKLVKRHTV